MSDRTNASIMIIGVLSLVLAIYCTVMDFNVVAGMAWTSVVWAVTVIIVGNIED